MDDVIPNLADIPAPAPASCHWTLALQQGFLDRLATRGSVRIAAAQGG